MVKRLAASREEILRVEGCSSTSRDSDASEDSSGKGKYDDCLWGTYHNTGTRKN